MNDIQKQMDALMEALRMTRADYHLTLGRAIKQLGNIDPIGAVSFDTEGAPANPHSYRGYYSDLAFESDGFTITVKEFLTLCTEALGKTFEGYKGGDFIMTEDTPLWLASYGCTGSAIMGIMETEDGIVLITKDLEEGE